MTSLPFPPVGNSDLFSVEVTSDASASDTRPRVDSFETLLDFSDESLLSMGIDTNQENFAEEFLGMAPFCDESNEWNQYLELMTSLPITNYIDENLLIPTSVPPSSKHKRKLETGKKEKKSIPLSESVGIGLTTSPHTIELTSPLEKVYRARYKTDYFAHSGVVRKPRYVADQKGNHFILLRVPQDLRGRIRIDWLTVPDGDNHQFWMPYRFQADNDDASKETDCNPIFFELNPDSQGLMKIYLVLIKSKQDALKEQQPLKPFQPIREALGMPDPPLTGKGSILPAKKLIEKYQLDKSRLAFTLCTYGADGRSMIPQWHTTIQSSTLTEEKAAEDPVTMTVACPNCAHACCVDVELDAAGKAKKRVEKRSAENKAPPRQKKSKSVSQEID